MNKWYEIIVEARKRRLLSAKNFAEMLGVTPVYLCRVEKGKQIPSLKLLKKICEILNLNVVKMAEKLGYSEQIEKMTNDAYNKTNTQEIVLKLYDMSAHDYILVLDLVKQVSKLSQKEKDIIRFIISSYVDNSSI